MVWANQKPCEVAVAEKALFIEVSDHQDIPDRDYYWLALYGGVPNQVGGSTARLYCMM